MTGFVSRTFWNNRLLQLLEGVETAFFNDKSMQDESAITLLVHLQVMDLKTGTTMVDLHLPATGTLLLTTMEVGHSHRVPKERVAELLPHPARAAVLHDLCRAFGQRLADHYVPAMLCLQGAAKPADAPLCFGYGCARCGMIKLLGENLWMRLLEMYGTARAATIVAGLDAVPDDEVLAQFVLSFPIQCPPDLVKMQECVLRAAAVSSERK